MIYSYGYPWRKLIWIFLFIILLSAAAFFLFRNALLRLAVEHYQQKIKDQYGASFHISHAAFAGLKTIRLDTLELITLPPCPLLTCDRMGLRVSLFSLLKGQIPFSRIRISNLHVSLQQNDSTSNYKVFFQKRSPLKETSAGNEMKPGYGTMLNSLFEKSFKTVTQRMEISRFSLKYRNKDYSRKIYSDSFHIRGNKFFGSGYEIFPDDSVFFNLEGTVFRHEKKLTSTLSLKRNRNIMIPVTGGSEPLLIYFDSLQAEINSGSGSGNLFRFSLNFSLRNLVINHWRIAPENVRFRWINFNGKFFAGSKEIVLDTSSQITLNNALLNLSCGWNRNEGRKIFLKIHLPRIESQEFFNSLPEGMFHSVQGIETKGKLAYNLMFAVDLNHPDSVIFESRLEKDKFRIIKSGEENFARINGPFVYTVYENEQPVRSISVSPENPYFTPLNQISDYLKNSVLISEDGNFFSHEGFNEEAFRQSIATNIKERRFARGGSTITMQLVKNVFLGRNKTIARKAEEALIVWLIERNNLVSKERMFEVYLNIIEWGPGIYGIGEAARFYFDKKPAELSLAESIFLASIIPHPKYFKYSFDSAAVLKPFISSFYRIVANHLVKKEKITQQEADSLLPIVALRGKAMQYFIKSDTSATDTIPDIMHDWNLQPD